MRLNPLHALAISIALAACPAVVAALPTQAVAQESSSWREVPADRLLIIDTSKGRVLVELFPDVAPAHVAQVMVLAEQGFYDGLVFHRVISGFMAQTGDPLGTGTGGSELPNIKAEFTFRRGQDSGFVPVENSGPGLRGLMRGLPIVTQPDSQMMVTADFRVGAQGLFCPGVVGMARSEDPNSANSQFYLMMGREDALNGIYTPIGRIVSGLEVVSMLKAGPEAQNGRVGDNPDTMTRARLASSLPERERPRVEVLRDDTPEAAAIIAEARAAKGTAFNICDVQMPSRVQTAG